TFYCDCVPRDLHSFPTRRSSDLVGVTRPANHDFHAVTLRRAAEDASNAPRMVRRADDDDRCESVPIAPVGQDFAFSFGSIDAIRSEEHTSELQSRENLVCRLLLE